MKMSMKKIGIALVLTAALLGGTVVMAAADTPLGINARSAGYW
jgi:hypothetical protein